MNVKGEKYNEIKIGRDITRDEFLEQFPNVRTVPYIVYNGTVLPSYEALKEQYEH